MLPGLPLVPKLYLGTQYPVKLRLASLYLLSDQ